MKQLVLLPVSRNLEIVIRPDESLVDAPKAVKDVCLCKKLLQLGLALFDHSPDLLLAFDRTLHQPL
jgi:hypothetical protein